MRIAALISATVVGLVPIAVGGCAGPATAAPAAPDMSGYQQMPVDQFFDTSAGLAYFKTPDGLSCSIGPQAAGCDGPLPGAPAGANEIAVSESQTTRAMRITSTPAYVRLSGPAAQVLPAGHKIAFSDFECAVGEGSVTACVQNAPTSRWMVISPSGTGIGPRLEGLPADFPDPNEFVIGDESYTTGNGAKNIFPVFTVANGLACKMSMYSGGRIGCDGKLPGVSNGDNEVYAEIPGPVGTRKADNPPFSAPTYPGPVRQLPAGRRVDSYGATCMATDGGGVACYGGFSGRWQGFMVTAEKTSTFGGS
jgi:hypothetical protein